MDLIVGGPTKAIARPFRRIGRAFARRPGLGIGLGLVVAWGVYLAQLARELGW
jgi:hypothetical protein